MFGVAGVIGAFAALAAGRLVDRRGPGQVASTGTFATLLAGLDLAVWNSLAVMRHC